MRIAGLVLLGLIAIAAAGCSGGSEELTANESMADLLKDASNSPDASAPAGGRNLQKPDADAKK
ncbi:MAG TPA: hypothetical protein VK171_11330 [Fimbriimonas sp.]|nr:hypothetical protein [Fimbriimonas sp.]